MHLPVSFMLCPVFVVLLTGCVGYVDGPRHGGVYVAPATVQVDARIVVQDDYVYYPGYQVYYSSNRRQYMYMDGGAWVTRATPPRVSARVLLASPSVRVDFHDSPANHHATVVKQYPKNWSPGGAGRGGNGRGHDGEHDEGQGHGRNDKRHD